MEERYPHFRSSATAYSPHRSELSEVLAAVLAGSSATANTAPSRGGGHLRSLDEIGNESLGRVEKFKAARRAILGKGNSGGDQEVNFLQHVFQGPE